MSHGIDAFHLERRRFERRLSGIVVGCSVALIALEIALGAVLRVPGVRQALTLQAKRFGYEGPEQFVRRIELQSQAGVSSIHPGLAAEFIPAAHKGGSRAPAHGSHPNAPPVTQPLSTLEGDSEVDREARARARLRNLPLVRSEDLVIENLVRPVYPEEARDKNLEGKVAVLALVDTSGSVIHVELVGPSEGLLERAAEEAVWKCRFRPYRVNGEVQQVYAMFHFSFRIYY